MCVNFFLWSIQVPGDSRVAVALELLCIPQVRRGSGSGLQEQTGANTGGS